jgi:hypothetical protein
VKGPNIRWWPLKRRECAPPASLPFAEATVHERASARGEAGVLFGRECAVKNHPRRYEALSRSGSLSAKGWSGGPLVLVDQPAQDRVTADSPDILGFGAEHWRVEAKTSVGAVRL